MTTLVHDLVQHVRRLISEPMSEMTRAQRTARYLLDFTRHCATTMSRDRAPQMASALTYRTIFSLVPTLVLSLLVFRAFYTEAQVQDIIGRYLYNVLNVPAFDLESDAGGDPQTLNTDPDAFDDRPLIESSPEQAQPPQRIEPVTSTPSASEADAAADPQGGNVKNRIDQWIGSFVENAYNNVNIAGIGVVGLVLLIWAALALIITVEQCFNRIYNASTGRAWHYRIMIYWACLTLGPVFVTISVYLTGRLTASVEHLPVIGMIVRWISGFTALGATWLLLFLVYVLLPATRVNLRPAVVGSFVAACLWETAKWGFKLYVAKASFASVYGSLGLIPLFLFWLYVSWLVVLFGLEVSYTLQTLGGYQLRQMQSRLESQIVGDPLWLVPMMGQIARAFEGGGSVDTQEIAEAMGLPQRIVAQIGRRLEAAGLLHRVGSSKNADFEYALARPPDTITLAQLIDLGHAMNGPAGNGSRRKPEPTLARILHAQREAVGDLTLADMTRGQIADVVDAV